MLMIPKDAKLAASFFLLAAAAIVLTRFNGGVALLWVANAPLIIFLSRRRPSLWAPAVLWASAGSVAASVLFGPVPWAAPFFGVASIIESMIAATLLRRWLADDDYFASARSIAVFSAAVGVLAPACGATIGATIAMLAFHTSWTATFVDWTVGRGLGTLIAIPIVLLLIDRERRSFHRGLLSEVWGEGGALVAAVAVTTTGIFWQDHLPLLFLPALPILLATFKLGRAGAAVSIGLVAVIGGFATASGHGPIMMTRLPRVEQFQLFQLYLAATYMMSLPIAGALSQRAQLMRALESSEARHRRIVARSQDAIFETDTAGRWTFLSEAWTRITSHATAESLGRRAIEFVFPEDRAALMQAVNTALGTDGEIGQAEVRFATAAGVRWAAFSVGLLRDAAGDVAGAYGTISDITERKRSDAAILESERQYRLLADNTTDMIARLDLNGCFITVTPASRALLGVEPDALVGTCFREWALPEHRPAIFSAFRSLLESGSDQSVSYRQPRPGRDPLWVEAAFRLLVDDAGQPVEVIASARDISRRKLLESKTNAALAQVQESNRLFGMAGALASVGHWRFGAGRENVMWSDEVFRIHGLEIGTPLPVSQATDLYHPDDRERVSAAISQAIAEQTGFGYDARIVRPDGSIRHVLAQGQIELDDAGEMVAIFGVFQDVTERALAQATLRDSEARFRLITEQASDMISLIATDGTCLFMSPASRTILGLSPDELIGTKLIDRAHEEDRAAIELYRSGLRNGETAPGTSLRFRMRRAGGDYAWLEASSGLATLGDVPCVVSLWRDVSPQVAIEAELKAAKAAAEAASVAKAGFLANMSHEIRTPMNGVIGFAELLLNSELSDEQRRDASLIAESGRAMMKLLNDILDLSKIEAGQLDVVSEPFDLPHALKACGKLLGPIAAQKRLGFVVSIADDLPRVVLGDALRIRQVVLNLLGNAIKFTEHGSIGLAARPIEIAGESWVEIAVSDTGIGIAPERQQSIFEEFVQADHSITRRYGGSGLGLAISSRLADLMGGRIGLESQIGRGTTVTVLVPATPADKTGDAGGRPAIASPSRSVRSARVLLAEDHEVNQLLVRSMLGRGGHDVVVVPDGQAAVDAVRRSHAAGTPFDLVFMDMQMPVMDGLAATRAIRDDERGSGRHLPIVALTANAFASDLELCREAGMDDHVAKPVSMEALFAAVNRWLQAPGEAAADTTTAAAAGPERTFSFRPSPAARAKYAAYRASTLDHVAALIRRGTFTDEEVRVVAELLHKLGGSAGMFGETALGDRASEMEDGLLGWPSDERAMRIPAAADLLRDAA